MSDVCMWSKLRTKLTSDVFTCLAKAYELLIGMQYAISTHSYWRK